MTPQIAIPEPCSDPKYTNDVMKDYRKALKSKGGDPVVISLRISLDEMLWKIAQCSAMLLPSCSADIDPQKYNEPRQDGTEDPDPLRATVDDLLLRNAYEMGKPVLGICYGLQSLNVWRGGKIEQDVRKRLKPTHANYIDHGVGKNVKHEVMVKPGSRLAHALKMDDGGTIEVISKHRQAASVVGCGLQASGRSRDETIEALEGTDPNHYVLAVQWHPERDFCDNDHSNSLIADFVKAAKDYDQASKRKSVLLPKPLSVPKQFRDFGESLHRLFNDLPKHTDITDTLDYLLGALYGLRRAVELDFRERSAEHHEDYRDHLAAYSLEIPQRGPVNPLWTAGFYFNSAIQRIASAFDRITQIFGEKAKKNNPAKLRMANVNTKINAGVYSEWVKTYKEVNRLKHPPSGLARGRKVTKDDALKAFDQTLKLLEKGKEVLIERYRKKADL